MKLIKKNYIGLVVDPIISFKRTIKIEKKESIELNLIISVSRERQEAIDNFYKYNNLESIERIFEISKTRTEEECRYLDITGEEIITYQKILSYILGDNKLIKNNLKNISEKEYYQKDLWKFGISGDKPIILVQISNVDDIYIIREIVKAYQYFKTKNINVDLVILDQEHEEYFVREGIINQISNEKLSYVINRGIYILKDEQIKDVELLKLKSEIIIDAHLGSLKEAIKEQEEKILSIKKAEAETELEKEEFEYFDIEKLDLILMEDLVMTEKNI